MNLSPHIVNSMQQIHCFMIIQSNTDSLNSAGKLDVFENALLKFSGETAMLNKFVDHSLIDHLLSYCDKLAFVITSFLHSLKKKNWSKMPISFYCNEDKPW